MVGDVVLQRFVDQAPVCVMVRATLEWAFAPAKLDKLFRRVAVQQYERELLFSTTVDLMSLVVCRAHPSVNHAYQRLKDSIPVSVKALYDKLNHVEAQTSRALVRHTAEAAVSVTKALRGSCAPLLPGYRVKILDGNHLQGTHHRLKVLRDEGAGALPGLCLAVLDPQDQVISDVIPCEDAHTQECRLLDGILETVRPYEVWIDDRHFCTSDFLFGLMEREAFFVTRQHAAHLRWRLLGRRKRIGRTDTGMAYEQAIRIEHPQTGATAVIRRITLVLHQPTRDGETEIHILTNLPPEDADAVCVAELYRHRWTLETAFQDLTVHLRCELNSLGYPPAALFGFCVAVACYNMFATVRAALRAVHGEEFVANEISNFSLVEEVRGTYRGLMIALPPEQWKPFQTMTARELAKHLRTWANAIDPSRYRKHRRAPKTRHTRPSAPSRHVATARLLEPKKRPRVRQTE